MNNLLVLTLFSLCLSTYTFGHGGVVHSKKILKVTLNSKKTDTLDAKYKLINIDYQKEVKAIFKKSCFDCHSSSTVFPWYYKIPGVKQLIDSDIKEAKKHLDFSFDFPFKSHELPKNDLYSISFAIHKKTMPPIQYRILHSDIALSESEKVIIEAWIQKSVARLK
jgi:hypothetical protein